MDAKPKVQKHSGLSRVLNTFKSIDNFGDSVSFQFNGQNQYNSILGSFITILILMTVSYYGVEKFNSMSNRLDTDFQSSVEAL